MDHTHTLFQQAALLAEEDPDLRALVAAGDEDAFRAAFAEALPDLLRRQMERNEELHLLAVHNVTPSGGYAPEQGRAIRQHIGLQAYARLRE